MSSPIFRSKRYDSAMPKLPCPHISALDRAVTDSLFFAAPVWIYACQRLSIGLSRALETSVEINTESFDLRLILTRNDEPTRQIEPEDILQLSELILPSGLYISLAIGRAETVGLKILS